MAAFPITNISRVALAKTRCLRAGLGSDLSPTGHVCLGNLLDSQIFSSLLEKLAITSSGKKCTQVLSRAPTLRQVLHVKQLLSLSYVRTESILFTKLPTKASQHSHVGPQRLRLQPVCLTHPSLIALYFCIYNHLLHAFIYYLSFLYQNPKEFLWFCLLAYPKCLYDRVSTTWKAHKNILLKISSTAQPVCLSG